MPGSDVYSTSQRRSLTRLAAPAAQRARRRRHERYFPLTRVQAGMRVLDVGCGTLGLRALETRLDITGVDIEPRPEYPGPFVRADAGERLPFDDDAFDLVYCSSVVEHVPRERRPRFANELRRVGRGLFVQTPAWSFPVEPHALLPFAHWVPRIARPLYWRLGAAPWEPDLQLLGKPEVQRLFRAPVHAERLGPLVKSWIVIAPVGSLG